MELKLKVRNKGYSGEVSRKLLKELVSLNGRIGFRGYTKNDMVERSNGVLTYSPTNIVNNKIVNYENDTYISQDKYKESPEIMVKNNDILFVKTGSTLGKSALVRNLTEPATINPQLIVIKTINVDSDYLAVYLLTDSIQKQVFQVKIGGAVPTLTETEIGKFVVKLPPLPEQSVIGSLFRTLDDLLASYKDNLANYQSIRANMLSKMFPKVGQTVPEIRLDGFEGEWKSDTFESYLTESRILGDSGLDAKKITVKLWGKGVVEKEEKYAGSSNTQYYIRKAGQFIYSKLDFQNQAFGIVPTELDGYQSTLDLPTFDVKGIDTKFLLEYVMRREFYEYQGLIANGSRKAKRIHPDDFLSMPVRIPSLAEQQVIGAYFSNLDQLITSYQEKITQLETLKKKLLQDMFI